MLFFDHYYFVLMLLFWLTIPPHPLLPTPPIFCPNTSQNSQGIVICLSEFQFSLG